MVGGLRAMTTRQLPPNCEEAITMLRTVLSQCTYPDLDLSNEEDAQTLLARRQCAEAAMQRLEIELGFREHRLSGARRQSITPSKAITVALRSMSRP
jgi:hypothetical protein